MLEPVVHKHFFRQLAQLPILHCSTVRVTANDNFFNTQSMDSIFDSGTFATIGGTIME